MIFRALPPDDVSTYVSFNDLTKSHDADPPLHHPSALWWESSTASTICLPNSSDLHNLQVLLGQILRDRSAETFLMTAICFPIHSFNLFPPDLCEDTHSSTPFPARHLYFKISMSLLTGEKSFYTVLFLFFWLKNETALHPYVGFCGRVLFIGGLEQRVLFIDTPAVQ